MTDLAAKCQSHNGLTTSAGQTRLSVNKKESEMKNKTIGVDLAKNVFEIGISTQPGQVDKTYRLSRAKFLEFFAKQEPATVVMEVRKIALNLDFPAA